MILTQLVVGLFLALRWRHFYGFAPIALILIAEFVVASIHGQPGSAKEMPARRSWVEWLLYTALLIFIIALGPPLIGGDAERSRFQQELLSRFLAAETQIR
jgi:hypothetical protein